MAMDNTPPRNRLIALYTALAVVTLVALKPAFDAYYDLMVVQAAAAHQAAEGFVAHRTTGAPEAVREALEAGLGDALAGAEHCYERHVARAERADGIEKHGALVYSLGRNADGSLTARRENEPTIEDPVLLACIDQRLGELRVDAERPWSARLVLGLARTQAVANRHVWDHEGGGQARVADAMASLARGGRASSADIRPEAAAQMDLEPLRGWTLLPQALPAQVEARVAAMAPAPEAPPEAPVPAEVPAGGEGAPAEGAPAEGAPAEAPAEAPPAREPEEAAPRRAPPAGEAAEAPPRPRRPPAAEGEAPAPRRPRPPAAEGEEPAPPRPRPPAAQQEAPPEAQPGEQ